MRIKFWVLSALMSCLLLILWLVLENTRDPSMPTAERERDTRPQSLQNPTPEPIAPLVQKADVHVRSDEKPRGLKAQKDRRDVNTAGAIDLDESPTDPEAIGPPQLRPAFVPRIRAKDPTRAPPVQAAKRPPFVEKDAKKRTRPRSSNLPKNIPAWFKEYDADGDGQVALHEWRAREKDVREFHKYDLNGDGYISVEELIRSGQFTTGTTAPGVLAGLDHVVGDFYIFEVTGNTQGGVWGSEVYTTDSPIAKVAVHAGVLRDGETGLVKVTVLPGQQHYYGSAANGVTTNDHHAGFRRSFRIEAIR